MIRAAEISADELYRYALWRRWDELDLFPGRVCWIMLNPSTADGDEDDATIRRCIDFSKAWGFGGLVVVNLFAYRATKPTQLLEPVCDPIGPDNDEWIRNESHNAQATVIAWGAMPFAKGRAQKIIESLDTDLHCLGLTDSGAPRHPLYVPKDTELIPYRKVSDAAPAVQ